MIKKLIILILGVLFLSSCESGMIVVHPYYNYKNYYWHKPEVRYYYPPVHHRYYPPKRHF